MPVLTLERPRSLVSGSSVFSRLIDAARQPLRMPAWAIAGMLLLIAVAAFAVGRHKPAHHYVSYFGYPMVLDTTTGKACYAAPPKPTDPVEQDASFAIDGVAEPHAAGPAIPMCGNE
jgi:hypothetical protein